MCLIVSIQHRYECESLIGKLLHVDGPAAENARSPKFSSCPFSGSGRSLSTSTRTVCCALKGSVCCCNHRCKKNVRQKIKNVKNVKKMLTSISNLKARYMQVLTLCISVRLTYRNSMTPLMLPVRIFSLCTLFKM